MDIRGFVKKYWIYIILAIILLFIFASFLFSEITKERQKILEKGASPLPSESPSSPLPITGEPIPGKEYFVVTPEDKISQEQDEAVVNLINALPYKGTNIYLSYSFSNFQFTLQENELEPEESEKEFNDLLTQYGIKDKSWLKNLRVQKIQGTQEETSTSPEYLFGR